MSHFHENIYQYLINQALKIQTFFSPAHSKLATFLAVFVSWARYCDPNPVLFRSVLYRRFHSTQIKGPGYAAIPGVFLDITSLNTTPYKVYL